MAPINAWPGNCTAGRKWRCMVSIVGDSTGTLTFTLATAPSGQVTLVLTGLDEAAGGGALPSGWRLSSVNVRLFQREHVPEYTDQRSWSGRQRPLLGADADCGAGEPAPGRREFADAAEPGGRRYDWCAALYPDQWARTGQRTLMWRVQSSEISLMMILFRCAGVVAGRMFVRALPSLATLRSANAHGHRTNA